MYGGSLHGWHVQNRCSLPLFSPPQPLLLRRQLTNHKKPPSAGSLRRFARWT